MIRERFRWLRTKLSRLFRMGRQEADLEEELRFHMDRLVEEFKAEGMSEPEARAAAKREFGHVAGYKEDIWNAWRPAAIAGFFRSIRLAFRSLASTPSFAIIAIITLGIGVGAFTSVFSLLNTVVLKPLPYPESEYLDKIYRVTEHDKEGEMSPADYFDLRKGAADYGDIAAFSVGDASLSGIGEPAEYYKSAQVTDNFFSTLKVLPFLGREFIEEEYRSGESRVIVISYGCWMNRYGGDRNAIGKMIRVDGEEHEIVGVLPESFNDWRHIGWVDVYRPMNLNSPEMSDRKRQIFRVFGRRAEGVSLNDSQGFAAAFGSRLAEDFPDINNSSTLRSISLNSSVTDPNAKGIFGMILGLSASVLLIACSSLANLQISRTVSRAREFAMKTAIGATRMQALNTLVFESLIIAFFGTIGAIIFALGSAQWIRHMTMQADGDHVALALDWKVLSWAVVSSLVTAVAFSLASALFTFKLDVNSTLKKGARGSTMDGGHLRMQRFLVVGQIAFAMILLAAAVLHVRGLNGLYDNRSGWDADDLVTGRILLPEYRYQNSDDIEQFQKKVLDRVKSLPNVESASLSWFMPFYRWHNATRYTLESWEPLEVGTEPVARINAVSSEYFETMSTRLLSGRVFNNYDNSDSPKVCVINESMASKLFGDESAIGKSVRDLGYGNNALMRIVGVVSDASSLTASREPEEHQLYMPISQQPRLRMELAVKVSGVASKAMIDPVRSVLMELDSDVPIRNLSDGESTVEEAMRQPSALSTMLSAFAAMGLGLASLGIYGVISRSMALRSTEFGIRLALGAFAADIHKIGMTFGVKLSLIGAFLGSIGALGVSRVLATSNPELNYENGPVIVGSALTLIIVSVLACYIPSRRATRTSLVSTLQAD